MAMTLEDQNTVQSTPYDEEIIRLFVIATTFWGVIGFTIGVFIAFQLAYPALNFDLPWLNFGRLRPVHTSAVVFAFGGNALIGTSLYVVQRTCRASLFGGPHLGTFVFWGYQAFIVLAASGYVLGVTQSREYAEPEWYVDLWLAIVWVTYLVVFLGTILKRKEPHIYVSNWYYLAFIITIAMLHIVNNLALPVSFFGTKSYSLFGGTRDALTQWWYGHNAVGFFLTAGFLAMMYYFLPKQADRPIWSYRLSIINFWALIFLYIWAGPHHLHYSGALGWVAFVSFGALYYLVPRLWHRERLYSLHLVEVHFWIASIGIVLYITAMWVAGIMQGLMWRSYDSLGFLQYTFIETVVAMHPFYVIRALGGVLFLSGALVMVYNFWRTIRGDVREEETLPVPQTASMPAE